MAGNGGTRSDEQNSLLKEKQTKVRIKPDLHVVPDESDDAQKLKQAYRKILDKPAKEQALWSDGNKARGNKGENSPQKTPRVVDSPEEESDLVPIKEEDTSTSSSDSYSSSGSNSYSSSGSVVHNLENIAEFQERSTDFRTANFFVEENKASSTQGSSYYSETDTSSGSEFVNSSSRRENYTEWKKKCGSANATRMGSGASKDGEEVVDEDPQYAQKSMAPMTGHRSPTSSLVRSRSESPLRRKGSSISRNLSKSLLQTPGPSRSMVQSSVSRFIDGYEEAIVSVTRGGFSMSEVTIMEGQVVTFRWEESNSLTIIQVVSDGEKLRPVIGGYQTNGDQCGGLFEQQFNLEGEYKFALSGHRSTPLSVIVRRRMDLQAEVTDDGFSPELIYIDQGHAVKWSWKNCSNPHYIQEVVFCIDRGCFKKQPANTSVVTTVSGSYRHQFNQPGIYYFQTESKELGKTSMCIVHVREAQREHKIEVLDRSFQPMILLIEQGDRVWWHWDRIKCKKAHSVYQIEPPIEDHGDDLYIPAKDGFRWSTPSKQGFLTHEFHNPGVFYFSDQNFEETAEYIGTIIVKPRQKEHFVELKEKGFSPDLVYAQTGDRIWWTWDGDAIVDIQENLLILEEDKCLNPVARQQSAENEDLFKVLDENSATLLTKVGVATTHFNTIGVYHYRIADTSDMFATCSIIVNPGPKNHTVHLTDNGFEPKVLTVRPNDRIWWVWQSCKKQHNIIQVSHQGVTINNGFHSGQTRDSPSAFQYQFLTPGVYYFISSNLPKIFGAIVVSTQPQVHEIAVSKHEIKPDPVSIQLNDIVCWVFRGPRSHGVAAVETVDQVLDAQFAEKTITPRRCIAEAVRRTGTLHYYSKSFQSQKKTQKYMEETRMSSVICDERFDNAVIRIDKNGFHPSTLFLQKGQSVLWTWKGTDQEHNVIHVSSPNSEQPLDMIQGAQSFNSGKPVPNNSFLYTFDENGHFTVASQGAPGYSCTVIVLDVAPRASEPFIQSEQNGGTVSRNERVFLACETEGASIFYTTDGTAPAEHSHSTKKYKPDQGVMLKESGLNFVRAIAVAEKHLTSHIFTSKRFWVLKDVDNEGEKETEDSVQEDLEEERPTSGKQWTWWNCKPKLKGCFTSPGVMEVFWEQPPVGARSLIKGYQIFLNGVSYCEMFPRSNNSLNVSGLAGGRVYDVHVEVYPMNSTQSTLTSNKLMVKCPLINPDGGPVISLEVSDKPDSLSIVWMSIDTEERPVEGYIVYLNDQQCGPKLVPDPDSNRCKVVIGSCDLHKTYKIHILALMRQSDHTRMSNVLEVQLPLDTNQITLPPFNERRDDDEMYTEFAEVHEGSGYLPQMDASGKQVIASDGEEDFTQSTHVLLDASTGEKVKNNISNEDDEIRGNERNEESYSNWRSKTEIEKNTSHGNPLDYEHKCIKRNKTCIKHGKEDEGDFEVKTGQTNELNSQQKLREFSKVHTKHGGQGQSYSVSSVDEGSGINSEQKVKAATKSRSKCAGGQGQSYPMSSIGKGSGINSEQKVKSATKSRSKHGGQGQSYPVSSTGEGSGIKSEKKVKAATKTRSKYAGVQGGGDLVSSTDSQSGTSTGSATESSSASSTQSGTDSDSDSDSATGSDSESCVETRACVQMGTHSKDRTSLGRTDAMRRTHHSGTSYAVGKMYSMRGTDMRRNNNMGRIDDIGIIDDMRRNDMKTNEMRRKDGKRRTDDMRRNKDRTDMRRNDDMRTDTTQNDMRRNKDRTDMRRNDDMRTDTTQNDMRRNYNRTGVRRNDDMRRNYSRTDMRRNDNMRTDMTQSDIRNDDRTNMRRNDDMSTDMTQTDMRKNDNRSTDKLRRNVGRTYMDRTMTDDLDKSDDMKTTDERITDAMGRTYKGRTVGMGRTDYIDIFDDIRRLSTDRTDVIIRTDGKDGKRKRRKTHRKKEMYLDSTYSESGILTGTITTNGLSIEEIPQKSPSRVVEVETKDGDGQAPLALKKKTLHSYASHDDYMRAQQEAPPHSDVHNLKSNFKQLVTKHLSSSNNDDDTKTKRRFSFYTVGLLILHFVSQEKHLQKGVAPNMAGGVHLNWSRLKKYFSENKPVPKMDVDTRKHPKVSLTIPSPERGRRRVDYDGPYDQPMHDDEEQYRQSDRSHRNAHAQYDYRRSTSFDRGDEFESEHERMWRDGYSRPYPEEYQYESRYRKGENFSRNTDYGRQRSRPQRGPSRSDHPVDYPPEGYRRQRSFSRSPDRSSLGYGSYRGRDHSYSPPPKYKAEQQELDHDWQVYQAKRKGSFGNSQSQSQSQSQRPRNTPRGAEKLGVNIPIYQGDDSDDSDDFGSEDAEHLYRAPRHLSRSRSYDLDDRKAKGVTFSFDQSEDPDYLYDEDSFCQLPSAHYPASSLNTGSQRSTPRTSTPRYQSNSNLKSILKNSDSFQDEQEYEDCMTPPPTCGGMLHRYLDTFQNIPNPDVSVFEEDQSVMTDDNYEKGTQTPRSKGIRLIGQRNRMNGEVDYLPLSLHQGETSSSESEAESDDETDDNDDDSEYDDNRDRNVVVLDVTKNQTRDYSDRFGKHGKRKKSARNEKSRQQGDYDADDDGVVRMGLLGKPPTGKKKTSNAIVEVQQIVELDVTQQEVNKKGDTIRQHKLAVPATSADTMKQVGEGEFVVGDGDGVLPAPSIMVESHGKHGVKVMWKLPKQPDPEYRLILYVVNVVGTKFTSEINSDISFECNLVEKERRVRGVQHCWNIQGKEKCAVKGLIAGLTYRIYVIANYNLMHGQQPCEVQTSSSVIYYTTLGPPKPPKVKVVSVDLYQACIEWVPPTVHSDMKLKGFQIYVDNKPLGGIRSSDVQQMIINNMIPGKTINVYVVAVTSRANQESDPSKTIHLSCPRRPPEVYISQQPSYKKGCVLIAWNKPHNFVSNSNEEAISLYSIYVDGRWHGEVKANKMCDQQGYQFFLTDLSPENSYDISVKAISGTRRIDTEAQHVFCLSDSSLSNLLPVMAPAAPKSPKLRLEGLHPGGIDVTWQVPQQFGDACISGYQMLKNGKLYGSIIPPDVNSLRIRDVSLGEKINLQLIALTEHPVGKDARQMTLDAERDSGVDGLSQPDEKAVSAASTSRESQKLITFTNDILTCDWPTLTTDVFSGDRYTGCKPGLPLVIHYTGLVQAPLEVWCEMVSGHSALIVWNTEHNSKAHFVHPDSYQVTWWPGDTAQDDINSDSTTDDHLLITNLRPCTAYTVVVEARKMEKYTDIDEGTSVKETPDGLNAFILTAKSEQLAIKTASPPDAPRNLGVVATTCNSLRVAWDPPLEHGVEVIGMHLECVSLNTSDPHHISVDVMPDSKEANIENLHEKTDYLVRVIAVTEEYFDRLPDKHRHKRLHSIPKDTVISPDDSPWLPNSSVLAKTAGTEPPANLKVVKASRTSLTLSWTPPLVYGSNKLQSQIVRWADLKRNCKKDEDLVVASHVNLLATEDSLLIEDLAPGVQYRIVVEAIVSIKTSLDPDKWDSGIEKYRRTAHVMSAPLLARTRAPIEPPQVLLMSYTQSTANLYWEKPQLMSLVGKDEDGNPEYLRRYLEGYKLEVNGKLQCCLGPSAQNCTLTKCRPGKVYEVALVAMTCTEEVKKQRKQRYKGFFKNTDPQDLDYTAILQDEEDLDESPSDPVEIVLPRHQDGFLSTLSSEFEYQAERDNKTFGDVVVSWTCQGGHTNLLKQFSIIWYCQDDRVIQTRYVNPEQTSCTIPITRIKSVYNITVEPVYFTDVIAQPLQGLQIMIPGPPDAPEIFLKSVEPEEFIIEWGEPRLFGGVKIKAYQVYLNDKKAGNELSSSHRKAVIPCRANRTYKVNLVALSSNPQFGDSVKSNSLLINTSAGSPRPGDSMMEDWSSMDDHEIPLKITKVMENSITLDWSGFLDTDGVAYYKIQWSSVAQPAQREVRLSEKDSNCVINKCLPGTTHFVRLVACKEDGQIVDKSKQLTVQTSAPPDSPIVSVRACNFRYIAIQWEKANTYGEALVTGYKVYVNGIVESILNKDQLNFTYTHGKWCHEYSFQVQALATSERLNSKPSEPLIIAWPGAKAPAIFRIPSVSSSSLRVGWEEPYATEGVKVKHYRLCCVEEDTEKVIQSIGPIHPDTREAEFKHLKKGNYCVYLEVHMYGTSDVIRSDMIRMQPALSPDPPHITVTIVGLEERRQIEKFTCDLVNKRDRLIRAVGHKLKKIGALSHPVRAEKSEDVILGAHTLTRVEEILEDCFNALENYTGQLIAHVSWQCIQSNPDMLVTGYKVLIDGKQYGNAMHSGIKTVRIKLGLEQTSHKLAVVSLTEKPQGASEESNIVELLTTPFKPFAFYCYHPIHNKDKVWPQYGCCKFQDSIGYERQVAKKLANQGLLQKHVPPPSCSLLDIFDGEFKPMMSSHNKQYPTILLFWTPWCLASANIMTHFTRFARDNANEVNMVAVTCGISAIGATERKSLIHSITSNGWREDGVVWHVTSECASSIYEATNNILRTSEGLRLENRAEQERKLDLTELLGIAGVPTFLFIHPDGYIAWHGRYSAFDYASFTAFMRHTISEVVASPCPVFNCDCCQNDMALDEEIFTSGILSPENRGSKNVTIRINDTDDIPPPVTGSKHSPTHEMKYAAVNGYTENVSGTERVFLRRRTSPTRSKRRTKITVNTRPFSASATPAQLHNSPYLARLRPASPVRSRNRPSSAKRLNYYV